MRITVSQLRRMIREAINEKIDPSKGNFQDVYSDKDPKSKGKSSDFKGKSSDTKGKKDPKESVKEETKNLISALQKKDKKRAFASLDALLELFDGDFRRVSDLIDVPENKKDAEEVLAILNEWFRSKGQKNLRARMPPEEEKGGKRGEPEVKGKGKPKEDTWNK